MYVIWWHKVDGVKVLERRKYKHIAISFSKKNTCSASQNFQKIGNEDADSRIVVVGFNWDMSANINVIAVKKTKFNCSLV